MSKEHIMLGKIDATTATNEDILDQFEWRLERDGLRANIREFGRRKIALTFTLFELEFELAVIDADVLDWAEHTPFVESHASEFEAYTDILDVEMTYPGDWPKKLLRLSYSGTQLKEHQLRQVMTLLVNYFGGAMPPANEYTFSRSRIDEVPIDSGSVMNGEQSLKGCFERALLV